MAAQEPSVTLKNFKFKSYTNESFDLTSEDVPVNNKSSNEPSKSNEALNLQSSTTTSASLESTSMSQSQSHLPQDDFSSPTTDAYENDEDGKISTSTVTATGLVDNVDKLPIESKTQVTLTQESPLTNTDTSSSCNLKVITSPCGSNNISQDNNNKDKNEKENDDTNGNGSNNNGHKSNKGKSNDLPRVAAETSTAMAKSLSMKPTTMTSSSKCKMSPLNKSTLGSQVIPMSSLGTSPVTTSIPITDTINITQITVPSSSPSTSTSSPGRPANLNAQLQLPSNSGSSESANYNRQMSTKSLQMTVDTSVISQEEFTFGIEVLNVTHTYDHQETILNGLTMKVEHGSIYGLLGASGCGKTTLLKCLIGMMKPTTGTIDIFGRRPLEPNSGIPGRIIGYMPQEIALYQDLTIEETLLYFGRLYFMDRVKMKSQISYLIDMLDLPSKNRMVSTLSGGQMRRVSFAAALIHEPPLVILDEPTAGVDPILRSAIWKYLVDLSKNSAITIIITTHYIEEAKLADRVGLMRNGQLLAEESPVNLLNKFNCATLEDVFLALCTKCEEEHSTAVRQSALREQFNRLQQQTTNTSASNSNVTYRIRRGKQGRVSISNNNNINNNNNNNNNNSDQADNNSKTVSIASENRRKHFQQFQQQRSMSIRPNDSKSKMRLRWHRLSSWASHFNTLMWKNYIRSVRHPLLIIFQYILPAVQIILFGICIGGDPFDIKVGIVNDENPPYLSDLFIQHLDTYFINALSYSNISSAKDDVFSGKLWGYIHFNSNYSDALIARLNAHDWGDPDNETIAQSRLLVHADLTDKLISLTIERSLEETYQEFAKSLFKEFNLQPELATLPIVPAAPVYGSYKHESHKGYREYMAPGILLSIAFSMAYGITCLVLILEREEKTFERNFVTGVTSSQIIIAHTLIRMIFMLGQGFVLLFLTIYLFGIPSKGPVVGAILLLMSQNLAGISYGMLLSAIFKRTHEAAVVAIGTIFFIILTSGVIWSVEAIPMWFRWFSYIQPCTIPNGSLRSVLSRGFDFSNFGYWKGIGVSIIWTLILFTISIKNYSYT